MAFTELCCRAGGSNLNAGTLDGINEPSVTPSQIAAGGSWNASDGKFAPAGVPLAAQLVLGNSEGFNVASTTDLQIGNVSSTFAGWVYFDTLAAQATVLGKRNAAEEYLCEVLVGGVMRWSTWDSLGTLRQAQTAGGAIVAGQWYFLVLDFDSAAATVSLTINNGTPVTVGGVVGGLGVNATALSFGRTTGGAFFLNGRLSRWGFWNRVLTGGEKTSLYNAGAGKLYASLTAGEKTGLVSYWNMNEAGGTRSDSQGANHATESNTVSFAMAPDANVSTDLFPNVVVNNHWASVFRTGQSYSFNGGGGGVPNGWAADWVTSNVTWAENAGGFLRATVLTQGRHVLRWATLGTVEPYTEVKVRVRPNVSPGGNVDGYAGLVVRGSGAAGTESAYYFGLAAAGSAGFLNVRRIVAGTDTQIAGTAFAWNQPNWYYIRLRISGSNISAKAWREDLPEPAFQIVTSESSITGGGWIGIHAMGPAGTYDFTDFELVNGDSDTTGFSALVTAKTTTTVSLSLVNKSGTPPINGTSVRTFRLGGAWRGMVPGVSFPFGFVQATMTNTATSRPRSNFKNDQNYNVTGTMTHSNAGPIQFQGYASAFGDGGKATIDGGTTGSGYTLLTVNNVPAISVVDLIFQNNGSTGSPSLVISGVSGAGTNVLFRKCVFANSRGAGLQFNGNGVQTAVRCEAYACNKAGSLGVGAFVGVGGAKYVRCISHHNTGATGHGFTGGGMSLIKCIAESNGGHGYLITLNASNDVVTGCDFYNNGLSGITIGPGGGFGGLYVENSNFLKNGAFGLDLVDLETTLAQIVNCGFGAGDQANTSGAINQSSGGDVIEESGSVSYPADVTPWVDPTNGDFRIALDAATGTGDGSFTQTMSGYGGTVGYPDIGSNDRTPTELPDVTAQQIITAITAGLPPAIVAHDLGHGRTVGYFLQGGTNRIEQSDDGTEMTIYQTDDDTPLQVLDAGRFPLTVGGLKSANPGS